MKTVFKGKRISDMLAVLPEKEVYFEEEVSNYSFPERQTMRLKKLMGFKKHRLSKETSTVSDFAAYGLRHMFDAGWIGKDDIGAIVAVSLCPDHFVPHISNIVHGAFHLPYDVMCLDIPQGCCGFLVGLAEAFMLLEHMDGKKAVLINGDVLSHRVSKNDRNDFPLMGDGAAITVIENDDSAGDAYYEMHMDGARGDALKIPAGGFRMPCTAETSALKDTGDGNMRSLEHMHMDGTAVFSFVQEEVPPMLEKVFKEQGVGTGDFDYFLFHQPNRFMLQKLAQKAKLPEEKTPMNLVENFGNTSGACIPMTAIYNYKDELLSRKNRCCLCAFGSGLAWGVMLMDIGELGHCEMVISDL